MLKGVSKETKVGSLTAISITILILGYNYMVGKDNPLTSAREFLVFYDSTQGMVDNTPLMFNGFRIGQLKKLTQDENTGKIIGELQVFSGMHIPIKSYVKIESSLLGTTTLKLILSKEKREAEDGDTLLPMYTRDVMSMVNEKIAPIAAGADSLMHNLNALIGRASVKQTFDELPQLVSQVTQTIEQVKDMIASLKPGLGTSMDNLADFSQNLDGYGKSLDKSLKSFEKLSTQMDSIQIKSLIDNLDKTIASLSAIASDIKAGKGTLGKLAYDDELYKNLNAAIATFHLLETDIKNYPAKYFGRLYNKKERKQALEQSNQNKQP